MTNKSFNIKIVILVSLLNCQNTNAKNSYGRLFIHDFNNTEAIEDVEANGNFTDGQIIALKLTLFALWGLYIILFSYACYQMWMSNYYQNPYVSIWNQLFIYMGQVSWAQRRANKQLTE